MSFLKYFAVLLCVFAIAIAPAYAQKKSDAMDPTQRYVDTIEKLNQRLAGDVDDATRKRYETIIQKLEEKIEASQKSKKVQEKEKQKRRAARK